MTRAHWLSSEIMYFKYEDGIKGKRVSAVKLYVNNVNENMKERTEFI